MLLIASGATIATTPAQPPEGQAGADHTETIELRAEAPRATGRLQIQLSAEAVPRSEQARPRVQGEIRFTVSEFGKRTGSGAALSLKASALGVPEPAAEVGETSVAWPIAELCRPDEPCTRSFDLSVEWLRPAPGERLAVRISADLRLRYPEQSPPPRDTRAAIVLEREFEALPAGPAVEDAVDLGDLQLGRENTFAARHVLVRASAEALPRDTAVDASTFVTLEAPFAGPAAAITVTSDRDPTVTFEPGETLDLFEGCERAVPCVRGFTVVAQWTGAREGEAPVNWSFNSIVQFPDARAVPRGASVSVEIDRRVEANASSPRLHATASGVKELKRDDRWARADVILDLTGPPTSGAFLDAPPPAIAELTIEAVPSASAFPAPSAAVPETRLRVSVSPSGLSSPESPRLGPDRPSIRVALVPFAGCQRRVDCKAVIHISAFTEPQTQLAIRWTLAVSLAFPEAVPPATALEITERGTP